MLGSTIFIQSVCVSILHDDMDCHFDARLQHHEEKNKSRILLGAPYSSKLLLCPLFAALSEAMLVSKLLGVPSF